VVFNIAEVGFGMLRHFIEYKAKLRNCIVVIADRFFPSSLTLADRIFSCDCGLVIDRDLSAAINLYSYENRN
jgi:putative transposase